MYVELFSIPGAGKSTLARTLAEDGSVALVDAPVRRRGIVYALRHPFIVGYWFLQIVREAYATHTWRLVRFKCALLIDTCAKISAAQSVLGVAALDEGFLQRMLSVFETAKDIDAVDRALRYMPVPDAVVCVTGNTAHHFKRYRAPDNDRARYGEAYLASWEAVLRHNYRTVLCALAARGIPYYTYDPATATVEDVRAYLTTHG